MQNPFNIVKDSSLWQTESASHAINNKDPYIRIGIIKQVYREERNSDVKYLVEIQNRNTSSEVTARMMRRFGGVFNYEDIVHRGYKIDDKPDPVRAFEAKAGDSVVVAFLNGEGREGIILGSLMHAARASSVDVTKGPQYVSEFNGIETTINESGEYKVTFKAIPTNIKKLEDVPSKTLPKPIYDTKVGGSFYMFDKTGSYEVNDKDQNGVQNIRIDKPKGTIEINSGKIKLTLTKKEEKVTLKCKILDVTSDDKITGKTKEFSLNASKSVKINSPKVAIGKPGVELLDQIFKLVDMLAKVTPISPVGPCTPLMSTPQWSGVKAVQAKIKEITGAL